MLHLLAPKDDAEWPDNYPVPLGKPEDNDALSYIALVLIDIAALCATLLPVSQMFSGKFTLQWYDWLFFGFGLAALGMTAWPWIVRVEASENPTSATTFRSWRINFLIGLISSIISILISGYYLYVVIAAIVTVLLGSAVISLIPGASSTVSSGITSVLEATWYILVLAAIGASCGSGGMSMLFYNKNFWYNYDPDGMRLTVEFDYGGEDLPLEGEEKLVINDGDNQDAETDDSDTDFWNGDLVKATEEEIW